MKNIFILPTDQPSRLYKNIDGEIGLTNIVFRQEDGFSQNQHIYITSSEEIKEGVNQWYLDKFLNKPMNSGGAQYGEKQNVIILTTDPTLITDGVQAIDDEFLEWFVKNPSCEFVEVNKKLVEFPLTFKMMYKIIIPQDEPKQDETGKYFADNADVIITMERPKEVRYSEDEVRELLIKGLTHNDDKLCGSLVTVQKEIRTANFNVWFEENKKK
jgi:hypothetical protein